MNAQIIAFPGCAVPEPEPRDEEQFALDVSEAGEGLCLLATLSDPEAYDREVAELRDRLNDWLGDG